MCNPEIKNKLFGAHGDLFDQELDNSPSRDTRSSPER